MGIESRGVMRLPTLNIWQRIVFALGGALVLLIIIEKIDDYDERFPTLGVALAIALIALAVSPRPSGPKA